MRIVGYLIALLLVATTTIATINAQQGVYPSAGVYLTFSTYYTSTLANTMTETIVNNLNAQSVPSFKVDDGHITVDISNIQQSVGMNTPFYLQTGAGSYQAGWKQVDFTIHMDYEACYKWHMADDVNICEHGKIEIVTTNSPNVTLTTAFNLMFDSTSPSFSDVSTVVGAPGNAIEYSASCESKVCDKTSEIRDAVADQFIPSIQTTITEQLNAKASTIAALFPPLRPLPNFSYKGSSFSVVSMGEIVEGSAGDDLPPVTFAVNGGIAVSAAGGGANPVYPSQAPTFTPPASAIEDFHTTEWQVLLTPFFFESMIDAALETSLPGLIVPSMVPADSPVTLNTSDPFFSETAPGMTQSYPNLAISIDITTPGSEQSTFSCSVNGSGIVVSQLELLATFVVAPSTPAFTVLIAVDATLDVQPTLLSNGSVSVATTMTGFNPSVSVASTNVGEIDTDGILQMLQLIGSMAAFPNMVINNPSTQYQFTQLEAAYNNEKTMIVEYHCERLKHRVLGTDNNSSSSSSTSIDNNHDNNKQHTSGVLSYNNLVPVIPKAYYFLLFFCFGTYRPFIPIALAHIKFTPSLIGLTLAFPPFISFVSSPMWSAFCDKYKCHRQAVVISAIMSSLLIFLLYFVENHAIVFCIVLFNAVFWSPLIPILDSTTLKILGPSRDLYGKQRMYGSVGFAVSATSIGILAQHLDNFKIYWINYPVAMMIYMVLILVFYYDTPVPFNILELRDRYSWTDFRKQPSYKQQHIAIPTSSSSSSSSSQVFSDLDGDEDDNEDLELEVLSNNDDYEEVDANNNNNNNNSQKEKDNMKINLINDKKSKSSTPTTPPTPSTLSNSTQQLTFFQSLKILLSNFKLLMFLVNALIVSLGMSMNNNFLGLVIVNDFKGPSSLIGIASIMNVTFELVFFFFGKQLLEKWGTKRLIILSHVCLIIRVVGYIFLLSVKASAWAILPVELLHGIIFASIWSAGNKICSDLAPKGLETTSQSLMFAVYLGLGMGLGALLGGSIYQAFGPIVMYTIILIVTVFGLILFLIFQKIQSSSSSMSMSAVPTTDKSDFEPLRNSSSDQVNDTKSLNNNIDQNSDDSDQYDGANTIDTSNNINTSGNNNNIMVVDNAILSNLRFSQDIIRVSLLLKDMSTIVATPAATSTTSTTSPSVEKKERKPQNNNNKRDNNNNNKSGDDKKKSFNNNNNNKNVGGENGDKPKKTFANDKVGEGINLSIEKAIEEQKALRAKRQECLNKMASNKERNTTIKKEIDPARQEFDKAVAERKAMKSTLLVEDEHLKRLIEEQKERRESLNNIAKDLPIKLKKDNPTFDPFVQIERNIAEIEKRIENEKSIQAQRVLLNEISELQQSKRRIQHHTEQQKQLGTHDEQITAQKSKVHAMRSEFQKLQKVAETKKQAEDPLYDEQKKIINENNSIFAQIKELANQIAEKSKFIDAEKARFKVHIEERRVKEQEERKKRLEEKAAYIKAQEEKARQRELAKIPYEEELYICDGLVAYLNTIKPKPVAAATEEKPVAAATEVEEGFQALQPKQAKKDNKRSGGRSASVAAPKKDSKPAAPVSDTIRHPMNIFISFDKLSLTPPEKYTQVDDLIAQVVIKKDHFSALSKQKLEERRKELDAEKEKKEAEEASATTSTSTTTTAAATPQEENDVKPVVENADTKN
ncbi:hypothetical protein DFA_08800 [Cavenderia fasciculata]|uniref:Major facilitator superfamily associated domain-containing protein n=1 Tax=Cavenderia fasciculata TaxID=261658 RepID=F4Q4F1_CACFS|nr:uncharacterized protein DFA_08800 [Cavenderia fasciculata]EGG17800.1 hypothetical protein DFA_08800 [Cavenderia fasciculata]|eukprot:XP_004356284.1 hypothetical protein DFA_08800 [Cavenderia fasciculata]